MIQLRLDAREYHELIHLKLTNGRLIKSLLTTRWLTDIYLNLIAEGFDPEDKLTFESIYDGSRPIQVQFTKNGKTEWLAQTKGKVVI